eukprot:12917_1
MSTIHSMRIPATKRQRISRLNHTTHETKLPKCSLIGIIKYLDPQSLHTFTKTSVTMYKVAYKYSKYQQELEKQYEAYRDTTPSSDTCMGDIDYEGTRNACAPILSSLSSQCADYVPSLSLGMDHRNTQSEYMRHLHISCDDIDDDGDQDIDLFQKERCSLLDILNDMKQFRI